MKTVLYTAVALAVLVSAGAAAYVYSGAFNVAATEPHWPISYWLMETARVRSIKVHASGIVAPAGFDDEAKVTAAVSHFSAHCAVCHGAPGTKRGNLVQGMYPQPPDLTDVSKRYTPGELFWILKNGIKMSGMPSMADDGDDLLWATVGLLEKLSGMSPDDYNDLWMASQAQGGMNHDMMNMGGMSMPGMNMPGMNIPGTGMSGDGQQNTPAGQQAMPAAKPGVPVPSHARPALQGKH